MPPYNQVQQFTYSGKFLRGIGGAGDFPANSTRRNALALYSHECLYVADTMNARIQQLATGLVLLCLPLLHQAVRR